jgi:dihydroorotase
MFDRPIIEVPEVVSLSAQGVMHEDLTQLRLGLAPLPAEAEDFATSRNLRLIEATGGRLHLSSVSTSGSVEICRRARVRNIAFTAGVHIANTHLIDELFVSFDSSLKVNPPLRSKSHVEDICEGLRDGTIDIISSGHRPVAQEKKMLELDAAPFGMTALDTAFAQASSYLVHTKVLDWMQLIAKMSTNPAKLMNLNAGSLKTGTPADIVVIDPNLQWTYRSSDGLSQSKNTPLDGTTFTGRIVETFIGGTTKWSKDSN